jgi:hypothetical protein
MPVATVKAAWAAISRPWSQVRERRKAAGNVVMWAESAALTAPAVRPAGKAMIMQ